MKRLLAPGVVLPLLMSACAFDGLEDESLAAGDDESISGMTLEAIAQDTPVIRGFVADGSGCRNIGNPVVAGNTVTFLLADYIAERSGTGLARATCDIAVEIDLPAGLTVTLDDVIYRGFSGGSSARSSFFREYFFAGDFFGDRRFTVVDYNAAGSASMVQNDSSAYTSSFGEFTALDRVLSVGQSRCGGEVIWRTNTSLTVRNDSADSFALAAIDTVDAANRHTVVFDFGPFTACN